jgi:hypothetical protein
MDTLLNSETFACFQMGIIILVTYGTSYCLCCYDSEINEVTMTWTVASILDTIIRAHISSARKFVGKW